MSGSMPKFDDAQTSRNKELLDNLVESQAKERMNKNRKQNRAPKEPPATELASDQDFNQMTPPNQFPSSHLPLNLSSPNMQQNMQNHGQTMFENGNAHSMHAMGQQTSQPWLPQNQPQLTPNILRDPQLRSHMAKGANKYRNKNWRQRFQMEIMESRKRNKDLQDEILGMNYREAKLRDQRDQQAKKMYEFATVDYFLVPELANVFGELSRNQANVSNHHEALLNRVDARTCQELELVADLVEQIKTQLDVYCRNRADFDAEQRKSNLGANSGSWYGFFQPSDSPRYNSGNGGMGNGGMGNAGMGNAFPNSGFNNQQNNNFGNFNNPEKAPSQVHILAKKCKESLSDLEEIVDRYYTQIFEHTKKALQMMSKAYIEYHTHSLEIFTKEWNDIDEFQPSKAALGYCQSLGLPDLKKEIEQYIKNTSNTAVFQQQMEMMNQQQSRDGQNLMSPWQRGNDNMNGGNGGMNGMNGGMNGVNGGMNGMNGMNGGMNGMNMLGNGGNNGLNNSMNNGMNNSMNSPWGNNNMRSPNMGQNYSQNNWKSQNY